MLLAEAMIHRFDPFVVEFSDGLGVRWYGLSYIVGFVVAWLLMRWMAATGRTSMTREGVGDLLFSTVIGVLAGGRLGYAVFYDPSLLFGFSASFPFWDMFALSRGGMASHGGMLGVIVVCLLHARRWKGDARHAFDVVAFACPPGLAFGRTANFINGELWGERLPDAMQADPPGWAIKYPEEILRFPEETQLEIYDALGPLATGTDPLRTAVDTVYAGGTNADAILETITPYLNAYWPSQVFQAIAEGPVLLLALAIVWWRPRKPGVLGCWFLIAYGLLRILTERFRQPDEGIDLMLGLSRGQWLSVAMIVVGGVLAAMWMRRDVPGVGGIGKPAGAPAVSPPSDGNDSAP